VGVRVDPAGTKIATFVAPAAMVCDDAVWPLTAIVTVSAESPLTRKYLSVPDLATAVPDAGTLVLWAPRGFHGLMFDATLGESAPESKTLLDVVPDPLHSQLRAIIGLPEAKWAGFCTPALLAATTDDDKVTLVICPVVVVDVQLMS
jgi:hypothetical protein